MHLPLALICLAGCGVQTTGDYSAYSDLVTPPARSDATSDAATSLDAANVAADRLASGPDHAEPSLDAGTSSSTGELATSDAGVPKYGIDPQAASISSASDEDRVSGVGRSPKPDGEPKKSVTRDRDTPADAASESAAVRSKDESIPNKIDNAIERSVAPGGADLTGMNPLTTPVTPLPGGVRLLIPDKTFRSEGKPPVLRVTYDDTDLLKVLNMEPVPTDAVDLFPGWLRALDGQRIRIRGFMFPTFVETGIERFALARDNGICCFVRKPKIYDIITVELREGVTTNYIEGRPIDVTGVFHIDPEGDDGDLFQLYRIDDAIVADH